MCRPRACHYLNPAASQPAAPAPVPVPRRPHSPLLCLPAGEAELTKTQTLSLHLLPTHLPPLHAQSLLVRRLSLLPSAACLCLPAPVSLSSCLSSPCLPVCVFLSSCLPVSLSCLYLSVSLPLSLSPWLSLCVSVCVVLSSCLPVCLPALSLSSLALSLSLSPWLSLCLSIWVFLSLCLPPSPNHLLPFQFFVLPCSLRSVTSGLLFSFLLITQQIPRRREPLRAFSLPAAPVIFKRRERTAGP